MADIKQDHKNEDVDSYGMSNSADPKNMQELTQYVSPHTRNDDDNTPGDASPRDVDATLTPLQVQTLLQNMQDKFQTMSDQIIGRIDEMGNRIDDLEKNIADLMTQAGVEGGDK
ncbi:heat shock factor-binding protein 1-like protein 1 isoform X1 [Camponotus floridanus]|uniref:heat shock factor-binding protein 1-like protein 1 isoform X1 n=1 Tax=Camponotus floridanus TaxID=104421 RepID=UPI000DC68E71|nr:heat shock factor-binding protein 1-like protein 1 isoform X1 [Camponotus floridanus]